MKIFFWMSLLFLVHTFGNAQTYKNVILNDGESEVKVDEINIDKENNTLSFIDDNQNTITQDLSQYQAIQYKKGSHWLAGMGGGFVGSLLGSVLFKSGDGEWWHGAGPSILVGTGLGALVGALMPKYKAIDLSAETSVEVSPMAIRIKF